ncbi:hypothetical protein HDU97_003437 [Phlyctochytrium planicorne]|nr:hypothetical protein HDU97_003437 [Phlyctochytrium planicorne]
MVFSSAIALLALTAAVFVDGHAILKKPVARKGMAVGDGIKYIGNITKSSPDPDFPPCDIFPQGPISDTVEAGSKLKVDWLITIDHKNDPGVKIAIQYDGVGAFETLAQGVDKDLTTFTVTLPKGKTADNAILQWQWGSNEDGGFYLGCADIKVVAPKGAALPPVPAPAPTKPKVVKPVVQPEQPKVVEKPISPGPVKPKVKPSPVEQGAATTTTKKKGGKKTLQVVPSNNKTKKNKNKSTSSMRMMENEMPMTPKPMETPMKPMKPMMNDMPSKSTTMMMHENMPMNTKMNDSPKETTKETVVETPKPKPAPAPKPEPAPAPAPAPAPKNDEPQNPNLPPGFPIPDVTSQQNSNTDLNSNNNVPANPPPSNPLFNVDPVAPSSNTNSNNRMNSNTNDNVEIKAPARVTPSPSPSPSPASSGKKSITSKNPTDGFIPVESSADANKGVAAQQQGYDNNDVVVISGAGSVHGLGVAVLVGLVGMLI